MKRIRILLLVLLVSAIAQAQTTVITTGESITAASQGTPGSVVNSWPVKVTDGTNGPAAVKPASTAAVATDPAVVVTLSPNSSVPAGTNKIGTVTTDQTTHGTTDLVAADVTKVAGSAVATGHGTAAGSLRVELPTDGTGVVGLAAGSNVIGKTTIDQTTSGTTNAVVPVPITGAASALSASGLSTVTISQTVKASAGNVYAIAYQNGAASVCWVQCVNSAGAGTLGTAPIFSIPMGASATGFVNVPSFSMSSFGTGIACGISTTNNGATACGTAGNLTIFYK